MGLEDRKHAKEKKMPTKMRLRSWCDCSQSEKVKLRFFFGGETLLAGFFGWNGEYWCL